MKNGLIIENGIPTYYEDDKPVHKGIVKVGDDIYYIGEDGKAVKGYKTVHSSMTHHIVNNGTYKFGEDYKMIKDYYKPDKNNSLKSSSMIKKTYKKDTKAVISFSVAVVSLLAVVLLMSAVLNSMNSFDDIINSRMAQNTELLYLSVPEIQDEVWLVSDEAKQIYTQGADVSVLSSYPYEPFYFHYGIACFDITQADNMVANLYLSESQSMENAAEYGIDCKSNVAAIHNLKVDTTYYYRLEVSLGEEKKCYDGSFKTAATNRFLYIPNLSNVRDVGGCKTLDGKTVKQNMIIRGTEADGLVVADYFLKDDYLEYVRKTFGFKSDLDLRAPSVADSGYVSRFGEDVKHEFFDSPAYTQSLSEENLPQVKKIFSFLADSNNYPMYLHCTYGKDRTGTIVYMLESILGVSDEDKMLDYELTLNNGRAYMDAMLEALDSYSGDTINEKVETYLIESVGITPEQIESIRSIMLTD